MCGSMADIRSAAAKIRRGKKERRKKKNKRQDENIIIWSALLHRATIQNRDVQKKRSSHKARGVNPEARRESIIYGGKDS